MNVSKFRNYKDTTPTDINILDWLRDDRYKIHVDKIRSEPDKSERDRLKAMLPAITPSGTFTKRGETNLIKHSGFVQFDVDKLTPEQIKPAKEIINQMPYTFYCGLSVSGLGLWGLFKISQPLQFEKHILALQRYFEHFKIEIDRAPSSVASLRGYSYDVYAYLNPEAEVFPFIYEQPKTAKNAKSYKLSNAKKSTSESVADDFNINGQIESVLIENGWKAAGKKGTNNRYTRPGKTSGVSGNYCTERKLFFVWSTDPETGLPVSKPRAFNHWAVYVQLVCNGDQTAAARNLYALGYGKPKAELKPQPSQLTPNISF